MSRIPVRRLVFVNDEKDMDIEMLYKTEGKLEYFFNSCTCTDKVFKSERMAIAAQEKIMKKQGYRLKEILLV